MLARRRLTPLLLVLLLAPAGCRLATSEPADLAGSWRAVLGSPGGELPFTLRITREGEALRATIGNGSEAAPVSSVERHGRHVLLRFDGYDSRIVARLSRGGGRLAGTWERTVPGGVCRMPFRAERTGGARFLPLARAGLAPGGPRALPAVDGVWAAEFADADGRSPAQGEFQQRGRRVTGTFLTPTGDYRYLEGSYEGGVLRLSTFDGAHAFLFLARARPDGTLAGDFWSRDRYHATWTAHRARAGEAVLPDAWSLVGLSDRGRHEGRLHFRFPDLDGRPVALDDPRFAGKVVLVNVFGSWCPNCNDEAPLLAAWDRRYRSRGLEIVGLAYEFTGDAARDRAFVKKFAERYAIRYPLLLAGTSDKKAAGRTLPDLTAVVAFPTTVFVGRDGRVRKIHTGFAGPGTGAHYRELVAELEGTIEQLLAEPGRAAT
jgi:thiol-disulfide isomerase/thioredoxin